MTDRDIYDDNGNRLPAQKGDFTQSFKATVARYDDLPAGKKDDYERTHPTLRQRLAEAIGSAVESGLIDYHATPIRLTLEDARAILAALQEAERRELHATMKEEKDQ